MAYKGYVAGVDYDEDAGLFHGEVVNTRAVITFQGSSVDELNAKVAATRKEIAGRETRPGRVKRTT